MLRKISTPDAPPPGGHYSQGIVHDGLVYVSGQLPIDPDTGQKVFGSVEEQTERVLKNMAAVLEAGGSSMDRVIKTTVYISDIQLWDRVNQVYAEHFRDHRPVRAVVPTRSLHYGFQVEIEAVGTVKSEGDSN